MTIRLDAIDVVIPVFGPGPYLDQVVEALQRQSPRIGRIIISHSGEGDPTPRFFGMEGVAVLHSPERLFAGAARNRGMALTDGEWVAFVDEDVIVDGDWHRTLLRIIAEGSADCILGSIGYAESGGYWGTALWFIEFSSVHPYMPARAVTGGGSGNMAVRAEALRSIGRFPEAWRRGQDSVAHAKLTAAGRRILFDPGPIGRHVNLPGFRRMLRHLYDAGRYSARLRREFRFLPGAKAVKLPALSIGLWLVRAGQIYRRVLTARGSPVISLLVHTPGIVLGLLAWNLGFTREAFLAR